MSGLIAVLLPVLLAMLLCGPPGLRTWVFRLAPWAPLALLPVLLVPGELNLGLQLVGLSLTPDSVAQPLLWLTLVAWGLAGWLAAAKVNQSRIEFWAGWLLALAGMNLLLLAGNVVTFYLGYAMVGLSAYLLVVHARTAEAWRAGRIYLILALIGEAAILAGVLLVAGRLGNVEFMVLAEGTLALEGSLAGWLFLFGFAIKLGILPLHVWLPLAHPVAPVPASAILSGVIVKAGLLGWLRLVPAAPLGGEGLAVVLLALGLATALGGVLLGLTQQRVKTVLAYSTISQMGLVLCGFSLWFWLPEQREAVLAMLGLLALHHGLNKAALFLACANQPGASRVRLVFFALPAVSLAAAPLTTGFIAKDQLKATLYLAEPGGLVMLLVSLSSTATALLMWRAFGLARQMNDRRVAVHPAWPLLVLAALVLPWWQAMAGGLVRLPDIGKIWDAVWPLLLAAGLIGAWRQLLSGRHVSLPEGDLVVGLEAGVAAIGRAGRSLAARWPAAPQWHWTPDRALALLERLASAERRLPLVGLVMVLITVMLLFR
ncbi:MAG: complex I subunit 5 family protein [Wenzhouxiangella sp.]